MSTRACGEERRDVKRAGWVYCSLSIDVSDMEPA
jgi:hypothetical protein